MVHLLSFPWVFRIWSAPAPCQTFTCGLALSLLLISFPVLGGKDMISPSYRWGNWRPGRLTFITSPNLLVTAGPKMKRRSYLAQVLCMTEPCLPSLVTGNILASVENVKVSVNQRKSEVLPTYERKWWFNLVQLIAVTSLHPGRCPCPSSLGQFFSTCRLSLKPRLCPLWFRRSQSDVSCHSILLHFCVGKIQYHFSPSREQKANEATRFLNYSLIWPQSSPSHKYTLIH